MIFIEPFIAGQACDLRGAAIGEALRKLGWRATVVPGQLDLHQRERLVRLEKPSVVLLQQTRHRLNHPKLFPGIPCVLDVDDSDIADPLISESVIDRARHCQAVIVGNRWLGEEFKNYNEDVTVVWTGSYLMPDPHARLPKDRAPIVTWAQFDPFACPPEAKLVQVVLQKLASLTPFEFRLYGGHLRWKAEAFLEPLAKAGVRTRILQAMPYRDFVRSLEEVAVGLQPICMEAHVSRGKSFGKLLAYMAAQVAIVASDELEHPFFFRNGESAALIKDNSINAWVAAIHDLLVHPAKRQSFVERANRDYMQHLTTARSAEKVDVVLRRVIGKFGRNSCAGDSSAQGKA